MPDTSHHPTDPARGPSQRGLVSVCIPTYNSAAFVAETIGSVLTQDYPSIEVVIADHGSTDGTPELLQEFAHDPRVRVVLGPPGGGAQANWNRATDQAVGEYVKLVCADDPLYPGCLSRQIEAMEEHPGVVLVASKRDIIDATGAVVYRGRGLAGLEGRVPGAVAVRRSVLAGTNIFGEPSSVLMRRDAMLASGPWSDALPYVIDVDMYVRVLQRGDLFAIAEPLATFRLSTTSWSLALSREQAAQSRAFLEVVAATFPDLRGRVLRIGSLRAAANAWGRRLAYLLHRRRLAIPSTSAGRGG
jgi:hypothetical protein